jgi:hypothetical protein
MLLTKQRTLVAVLLMALSIVGAVMFERTQIPTPQPYDNSDLSGCDQDATTTDCVQFWHSFENTRYSYVISYPAEVEISTYDVYGADDLNTESQLTFAIPGKFTLVGIEATTPFPSQGQRDYDNAPPSDESNKMNSLDLKSYAEALRALQVNDPNPYIQDRKIGELKEATIAGRVAYQFTIDRTFTTALLGSGAPLGDEEFEQECAPPRRS